MPVENSEGERKRDLIQGLSASLERGLAGISTPFKEFIHNQTVTSAILLAATLLAIVLANSPVAHEYAAFFETMLGIVFSDHVFKWSLHHWINDALMSLFFFIIGLEIKREIKVGELSRPGRTVPVIAAALGGMVAPAVIYLAMNASGDTWHGWGIPMATDTAFVIGILALLRRHVPATLVVFITALAIIDDIGAILVIAFFYTETLSTVHLGYAAVVLVVMALLNLMGVRRPAAYLVTGGLLWLAMLESGIHATVAGILASLAVPARPKHDPGWFVERARKLLRLFESRASSRETGDSILADQKQHEIVEKIHDVAEQASTPLQRWETALEKPVALFVLPIFALANAGVAIGAHTFTQLLFEPLVLGIVLGLVVGKCMGITLMTWLVLRLRLGTLAEEIRFAHIVGIGLLAGIGFTMSVFVAGLGFSSTPGQLAAAKTGVLMASLIAGGSGYLWLRFVAPRSR